MVKIALVSCGTEYSGIQKEIEKAANKFGAEIILPEIDLDYIDEAYVKFGFSAFFHRKAPFCFSCIVYHIYTFFQVPFLQKPINFL